MRLSRLHHLIGGASESTPRADDRARDDALETAKAILEQAHFDLDQERDRGATLDGKLTQLAAFSGLSVSISSTLGGSVIAAGRVRLGYQLSLGALLTIAAACLLVGVIVSFRGLAPKRYLGVEEEAARHRVTRRFRRSRPPFAVAKMAATQVDLLARAREIHARKAAAVTRAFWWVGAGFGALVLTVPVVVIGSVLR